MTGLFKGMISSGDELKQTFMMIVTIIENVCKLTKFLGDFCKQKGLYMNVISMSSIGKKPEITKFSTLITISHRKTRL